MTPDADRRSLHPTSAEHELLLALITLDAPPERVRRLAAVADWHAALGTARRQLFPYLAHRIGDWTVVPTYVRAELTDALRASAVAQLQRHAALRGALRALEHAGLSVIVLKGAALSYLVYPHPELRPMADVDLWVPLQDLDRVCEVLISGGFRYPRRTHDGVDDHRVPTRQLELPGTPILFELHAAPKSFERLGPERVNRLRTRAVRTRLADVDATVLSPQDMLLHVCLHVALGHCFNTGLLPLIDIGLVVRRWRDEYDWLAMAREYRELGVDTWLYLTLKCARDLVCAPVPPEFFNALPAPDQLEEMESLATEQLWEGKRELPRALSDALTARSWRERGRWLVRRLFSYYWPSASERPPGATANLREAAARVVDDIRIKVPRYVRAWRRGDLRGDEFTQRKRLAEGRKRIGELVAEAEVRRTAFMEQDQPPPA